MPTEEPRLDFADDVDGALLLTGEIDSYTAPELSERLAGDPPVEVLDLAGVTFIDSSGLRTLLAATRRASQLGTVVRLRNVRPTVRRMLEITGTADQFEIEE